MVGCKSWNQDQEGHRSEGRLDRLKVLRGIPTFGCQHIPGYPGSTHIVNFSILNSRFLLDKMADNSSVIIDNRVRLTDGCWDVGILNVSKVTRTTYMHTFLLINVKLKWSRTQVTTWRGPVAGGE